jgi:hypothetical protein
VRAVELNRAPRSSGTVSALGAPRRPKGPGPQPQQGFAACEYAQPGSLKGPVTADAGARRVSVRTGRHGPPSGRATPSRHESVLAWLHAGAAALGDAGSREDVGVTAGRGNTYCKCHRNLDDGRCETGSAPDPRLSSGACPSPGGTGATLLRNLQAAAGPASVQTMQSANAGRLGSPRRRRWGQPRSLRGGPRAPGW